MLGRRCLGGDHIINRDPSTNHATCKHCVNSGSNNNKSRFSLDCRTTRIKTAPRQCRPISTKFNCCCCYCCRPNVCPGGNARQHYCTRVKGNSRFSLHSKNYGCRPPSRPPKILCSRTVDLRRCLSDECKNFVRIGPDAHRFSSLRSCVGGAGGGKAHPSGWSNDFPNGDNDPYARCSGRKAGRQSSSADRLWSSHCAAESACPADDGDCVAEDDANWATFEREIEARIRAFPDFDIGLGEPCAMDSSVRCSSVRESNARGSSAARVESTTTESERHWNRLWDNVQPVRAIENERLERMRRIAGKLIENFIRKVKEELKSGIHERGEDRASKHPDQSGCKGGAEGSEGKAVPAANDRNSLSLPTLVLQPKTEKKDDDRSDASASVKGQTSPEQSDKVETAGPKIRKIDEKSKKAEKSDENASSSGSSSSGSSSSGSSGSSSYTSGSSDWSAELSKGDMPDTIDNNIPPSKSNSDQEKSPGSKQDENVIQKTEAIKYHSAPPKHRSSLDSKSSEKHSPSDDKNQPKKKKKTASKESKSRHGPDKQETSHTEGEEAASSDNGLHETIQPVDVDPEVEETLKSFATDVVKSLQTTIQYKLRNLVRNNGDEKLKQEILQRGDFELKNQILPTIVDHIVWIIKKEFRDKTEAQLKHAMSHDPGKYVDTVVTNAVMKTHSDLKAKRPLFKTIVVTSNCNSKGTIVL